MISPDEVRRKAERWWFDVLRSRLNGTLDSFFPKDIPQIGLDKAADKLARFVAIREEQEALHQQSKAVRGSGYSLAWTTQGSRLVGQNAYITRIYLESLDDFLKLTGKETDYDVFVQIIEQVQAASPTLLTLLEQKPQLIVEQATQWTDLLNVTAYFLQNPRPQQYVRSLPIAVPTKFIETNRPVLRLLLDHLIPDHLNANETDFYKRFHLHVEEPMVKLRFLDEPLRIHTALSHISVWLSEFRLLRLSGSRVFIIENLTTFLTFPNQPNSIAIWGGGFAVTLLGGTDWLREKQLYYWGDLDAHGFLILNQFREHFPKTQSLLMDRATFDTNKHLITKGESTSQTELPHLTDQEQAIFQMINRNKWRIEQERLEEEWVGNVLALMNYSE